MPTNWFLSDREIENSDWSANSSQFDKTRRRERRGRWPQLRSMCVSVMTPARLLEFNANRSSGKKKKKSLVGFHGAFFVHNFQQWSKCQSVRCLWHKTGHGLPQAPTLYKSAWPPRKGPRCATCAESKHLMRTCETNISRPSLMIRKNVGQRKRLHDVYDVFGMEIWNLTIGYWPLAIAQ
jgi:hypothetical protein